jgi:phosphoglycolate phosphatase-like HAD superfamily hydrolase
MVCEFGVVPDAEVLDATGYKAIYNETLLDMVRVRIARLKRGALGVDDYLIKGAVEFLRALRELDVTLYLASGTDREDVIGEAQTLGYAELFNGGMHGAVGDVSKYSKKMVIDKILKENHLEGDELAVFGDGPVEIRECRKVNGIAVGIASDEIRRHGLSTQKRTRLIKAGASLIAPDFSDRDALLGFLFG